MTTYGAVTHMADPCQWLKRVWLVAAMALALFSCPSPAAAQARTVQSDQETLIELERRWNEALYEKDLDFLRRVLADDFTTVYEDGSRGDKARELALVESFNQHVDSAVQDDFTVRVDHDTAIVWFTLTLVGPKQGVPTTVVLRYIDVWAFRDGRWQAVSSQSTRVSPK